MSQRFLLLLSIRQDFLETCQLSARHDGHCPHRVCYCDERIVFRDDAKL